MAKLSDPRQGFDPKAEEIYEKLAGPRGGLSGMYMTLMHHPELAQHTAVLGTFLRFEGTLPGDLRELAMLATARALKAPFIWEKHIPPALKEGLPQVVIDDVLNSDLASTQIDPIYKAVWQVARHVTTNESIPMQLQSFLVDSIGEKGLVEVTAVCGFYRYIASIVFSFDVELPDDGPPPF
jgi:4-carboxymuconolactone decarboxylase